MTMSKQIDLAHAPSFRIGPITVDPPLRQAGSQAAETLEPRVMQVLVMLALAKGTILSRNDLVEQCWDGRIVGDDAINRVIGRLRRLIEDHGDRSVRIETITKVGYRLIGEVALLAPGAPTMPTVPPVPPQAHATARPGSTVLAVLAFDNLSPDPDLAYFSDGVAEEILASVSRAAGIRVIGSASSFTFRGPAKAGAARALGASHILDGSVRRGDNFVRVSARLIDAETGEMLWTERFDRDISDALGVQDEIAFLTAQALAARFAPTRVPAGANPAAYDLYLRALAERRSPDSLAQRRAIAFLEAAVAMAPNFARAQAALSTALCHRIREATFADAPPAAFETATAAVHHAATRALAINPGEIEARLALLSLQPVTDTWASQDGILSDALVEAPTDLALLWYRARWLAGTGRLRESMDVYRQGYELNPLSPIWMMARANGLLMVDRDFEASERLAASAYGMARADPYIWHGRWSVLPPMRRFEEAWAMLAEAPESYGDTAADKTWIRAMENPNPENLAAFLATESWEHRTHKFRVSNSIPGMSFLGLYDAAFALLDTAMAELPPQRLWCMWNGNNNGPGTEQLFFNGMGGLRADPRFLPLCHRLGLCSYWSGSDQWPDFVARSRQSDTLKLQIRALAVAG